LVGAGDAVQLSEIVKRGGGVRMLGVERLLSYRQRAFVERLGLPIGADGGVQLGEIVERGGGVGMLGAEYLLINSERALIERLCLRVGAGRIV
jgi:hypothetical protein